MFELQHPCDPDRLILWTPTAILIPEDEKLQMGSSVTQDGHKEGNKDDIGHTNGEMKSEGSVLQYFQSLARECRHARREFDNPCGKMGYPEQNGIG